MVLITNKIVAARLENLFIGVDMMDDAENLKCGIQKISTSTVWQFQYNLGVQYAFGDEIVVGGSLIYL